MPAKLIEMEKARSLVLARAGSLGAEQVPLREANGRVLAEDLSGTEPVPAFDNSAMDGYAVRAADTVGASRESPVSMPIVAESRAGHPAGCTLAPGEAIAISTGAMVPEGADAIVRVEETSSDHGRVEVSVEAEPGRDLRRAGVFMPVMSFLALSIYSAPVALYPTYATVEPWGGGVVADQQAAAVVMWLVGNLLVVLAMLLVAVAWKHHDEALAED